jgi:hypothetical protein
MSGQLWFAPDLAAVIDTVSDQKFALSINSMNMKMSQKVQMALDKVEDLNAK